MKIYSFIAALAVCALLASCSNDDQENLQQKETKMLIISLLIITGIYFLANLGLVVIWLKNPIDSTFLKENIFETLKISVIIPVRNELLEVTE